MTCGAGDGCEGYEQIASDAVGMDETAFLHGEHWALIARELERTADRIVSRCAKRGYPFNL